MLLLLSLTSCLSLSFILLFRSLSFSSILSFLLLFLLLRFLLYPLSRTAISRVGESVATASVLLRSHSLFISSRFVSAIFSLSLSFCRSGVSEIVASTLAAAASNQSFSPHVFFLLFSFPFLLMPLCSLYFAQYQEWVKSLRALLQQLQVYVKQFHPTGVTWNMKACMHE